MDSKVRIDRIAPSLFPDAPYIHDRDARKIIVLMSERRRFDDLGAIAENWRKFSEGSRMRFGWLMTAATQLRLWSDADSIAPVIPRWKSAAIDARDRLIKIEGSSELPRCIASDDIDRISRRDDPLITSLGIYAKACKVMDDYTSETRGRECLKRAALLLKQSADLMAALSTESFQDLQKLCSLRLSFYDQSRTVFRDAFGGHLKRPESRAFLDALNSKISDMTSTIETGAIIFDGKKSGGKGGNGTGSLPPIGGIGSPGATGGSGGASAKGLEQEESSAEDCAFDDSYAASTDPYGLELGAETALFGVQPFPAATGLV